LSGFFFLNFRIPSSQIRMHQKIHFLDFSP
jgi:hypothetical protein